MALNAGWVRIVLRNRLKMEEGSFFLDPRYSAAGKRKGGRLFKYFELDHPELIRITRGLAGSFLMTYDKADECWSMDAEIGMN